jgi:hypothetical protein
LIRYLLCRTIKAFLLSTGTFPGGGCIWNSAINASTLKKT